MIAARLASGDCERIHDGVFAQPANSVSSVAYLVAGAALFARAHRGAEGARVRLTGFVLATAANGAGGLAYHGAGGALSRTLHDSALLATLGLVLVTDAEKLVMLHRPDLRRRDGAVAAPAVAGGAVVLALSPRLSSPAQVMLAVGAVAAVVAHRVAARRRRGGAAAATHSGRLVVTGAVAAAVYLTSRSGGPLCSPESVLQGHAGWHVLTAAMLYWWGQAAFAGA